MRRHFRGLDPELWRVWNECFVLEDPDHPTYKDRRYINLDAQPQDILCDRITEEEFNFINEYEMAKEVWDVLSKVNEGVPLRREAGMDVFRNKFYNFN